MPVARTPCPGWHASCTSSAMELIRTTHRGQPLEDWVDELSRIALVFLLLVTLLSVV